MYALYSLLSAAALVLAAPWLAWQAVRHGKYRHRWRERLGSLPPALAAGTAPTLWLHAVSVGEVLSAVPLVAAFRREHPDWRVVISTTTRTGRDMAEARLREAAGIFYFPLDFACIVRRVLRHVQPTLVVVVETEIRPNPLRLCRARGVGVLLRSAPISDRSFPRYQRLGGLLALVLSHFDRIGAQSEDTAARLRALGAPPERVVVTGSLKFDVGADGAPAVEVVARRLEGRPVLLAASTLRGEDEVVLEVLAHLRARVPDARLVIAPRHPERFDDVTVAQAGLVVMRRTALTGSPEAPFDVLVLDTIGELAALCAHATVVFVGGSLVPAGGHNILEPARYGRPIVVGPSMSNFAEIARLFLAAGALVQVTDASAASRGEILALFDYSARRRAIGQAAEAVLARHRGAVARTLREIAELRRARPSSAGVAALELPR